MNTRSLRKERSGTVVSNRMEKTIVVSVERTVMHPKYRKYLKRRTRVKAHDEANLAREAFRLAAHKLSIQTIVVERKGTVHGS